MPMIFFIVNIRLEQKVSDQARRANRPRMDNCTRKGQNNSTSHAFV